MKRLLGLTSLAVMMSAALVAHADPIISATIWSVPADTANNVPTEGNVPGPGATEVGTFTASQIHFSADSGTFTIGTFLNSFGAASNIVYVNGFDGTLSMENILIQFTGTAFFTDNQTFSVQHDDGVNLYVGGNLVLSAPGPTPPVVTNFTYHGPDGNQDFDFIYANGPPTNADFTTTLVTPQTLTNTVPEPASLLLLGTGATVLGGIFRRRFARA